MRDILPWILLTAFTSGTFGFLIAAILCAGKDD